MLLRLGLAAALEALQLGVSAAVRRKSPRRANSPGRGADEAKMAKNLEIIPPDQEVTVKMVAEAANVPVGSAEYQRQRRGEVDDVVREARKMARQALVTLRKLMKDDDPKIRFMSAKEVLERGFGRSATPVPTPQAVNIAIKILQ
jgi:hypothetical protein